MVLAVLTTGYTVRLPLPTVSQILMLGFTSVDLRYGGGAHSLRVTRRVTLRLHPAMRSAGDGSLLSAAQRDAIFRGEAVSPQEPPTRAGEESETIVQPVPAS